MDEEMTVIECSGGLTLPGLSMAPARPVEAPPVGEGEQDGE